MRTTYCLTSNLIVTKFKMDKYLKLINEYCQYWKIQINYENCESIVIRGKYTTVNRKLVKQAKTIQF